MPEKSRSHPAHRPARPLRCAAVLVGGAALATALSVSPASAGADTGVAEHPAAGRAVVQAFVQAFVQAPPALGVIVVVDLPDPLNWGWE